MKMNSGYFQYPLIKGSCLYFISEENLWLYDLNVEKTIKLTSTKGEIKYPIISSKGDKIIFNGKEEGDEDLFLIDLKNGKTERLTYLGSSVIPIMFYDNDNKIIFSSNHNNSFDEIFFIYSLDLRNGCIESLNIGNAKFISFKNNKFDLNNFVLQPYSEDMTRWKRYKGGNIGKLWLKCEKFKSKDSKFNNGNYRLIEFERGNISNPIFYENFIIFISDYEGVGNLYKSDFNFKNVEKLTFHEDFYVRNPYLSYEDQIIVYQSGGNIYKYDIKNKTSSQININYFSSKPQKRGKYINIHDYIQGYSISFDGKKIALNIRGKIAGMYNWYGPVEIVTLNNNVRDSLPIFLFDNSSICFITDELNEIRIAKTIILSEDYLEVKRKVYKDWDFGNIVEMISSPSKNHICLSNHRNEIFFVDLENENYYLIDKSDYGLIDSFSFSWDSKYIAYSFPISFNKSIIKIFDIESKEKYNVTDGLGFDFNPYFSQDGKYLLFISGRNFDPVDDYLQFEISFPFGLKPYLILLDKNLPDPFSFSINDFDELSDEDEVINIIKSFNESLVDKEKKSEKDKNNIKKYTSKNKSKKNLSISEKKLNLNNLKNQKLELNDEILQNICVTKIDFDGIEKRIIEFPISGGIYTKVQSNREKFFFLFYPIKGELEQNIKENDFGYLYTYNIKTKEIEVFYEGVLDFEIIDNGKKVFLITTDGDFRIVSSSEKPQEGFGFNPKDGYIDIDRIKIYIEPEGEWEQMFKEAWRLQRDYFWNEKFIKEDWIKIYKKYYKLLPKISTRTELSDIIKEMQGELGTSHCYEYGGDKRKAPFYNIGFLGIDYKYDEKFDLFKITKIYPGDPWIEKNRSPFLTPAVDVKEGDYIISIDGKKVDIKNPINKLLKNKANDYIDIVVGRIIKEKSKDIKLEKNNDKDFIKDKFKKEEIFNDSLGESKNLKIKETLIGVRHFYIKTISSEKYLRYRDWVDANREYVHKKSKNKIGYIHIPDMEYFGYSEFHKYFLKEMNYYGLIVDVRYNRGGFVSELILEKLSRKIIGYDFARWISKPETYPKESPKGPMIFIVNEHTGSDGDIFTYAVKFMKLGKIVGTRTWGGVIGVSYRGGMIDGAFTTQPEYIFWFKDIGLNIENFGVEPDYEVYISPYDWINKKDSQLDKAIEILIKDISKIPEKEIQEKVFDNLPKIDKF